MKNNIRLVTESKWFGACQHLKYQEIEIFPDLTAMAGRYRDINNFVAVPEEKKISIFLLLDHSFWQGVKKLKVWELRFNLEDPLKRGKIPATTRLLGVLELNHLRCSCRPARIELDGEYLTVKLGDFIIFKQKNHMHVQKLNMKEFIPSYLTDKFEITGKFV